MKELKKARIIPWVGENYGAGVYDKKILILGESHYGEPSDNEEDNRNQTIDVITEIIDDYRGDGYQQTFLCFERALAGREINEEERRKLWNSVMFYNYFQLETSGPRKYPNMDSAKMSEEAFRELLEVYQPEAIIMWGVRLFDLTPAWGGHETKLTTEVGETRIWHYNINGHDIPAMMVYHPSSPDGKSWPYWHHFHKAFIGEPKF